MSSSSYFNHHQNSKSLRRSISLTSLDAGVSSEEIEAELLEEIIAAARIYFVDEPEKKMTVIQELIKRKGSSPSSLSPSRPDSPVSGQLDEWKQRNHSYFLDFSKRLDKIIKHLMHCKSTNSNFRYDIIKRFF